MYNTRAADPADNEAIKALLPRLADFEMPPRRTPEMLWTSDAELVDEWAAGQAGDTFVRVAVDERSEIVAAAIVTMGEDILSHERSAHLEVIVVSPAADGHGLGRRLIREVEEQAGRGGAELMSLHVIGNNARARHVYEQLGYSEELIRCVTFLNPTD